VDDLGAVLVIAIFYTSDIAWTSLLVAGFVFVVLTIMNRMGVRSLSAYAIVGVCLWLAFLQSGIHATIAGVLLAMTIPVRTRINADEFASNTRIYLDEFQKHSKSGTSILTNKNQLAAIASIEVAAEHAQTPLQRMEHILHPWVSHVIMPVFAFANAGVTISGDLPTMLTQSVTLGVMAGLIFGKQIGVFAASYLAIKFKWADLPSGMTWIRLYGLAWLAGIGFTMSLFIAGLAFMDSKFLDFAKVGILFASVISGTVGAFILSRAKR
jgi:NhaA family Na+:H+ antiporter